MADKETQEQQPTVIGLSMLSDELLSGVIADAEQDMETRAMALRVMSSRNGGQYSGLERLDAEILAMAAEAEWTPADLRRACIRALTLKRVPSQLGSGASAVETAGE